jgi:hypothetical protein
MLEPCATLAICGEVFGCQGRKGLGEGYGREIGGQRLPETPETVEKTTPALTTSVLGP